MDLLRRFLVAVFGIAVGIIVSVLTLIYGWGLHPQSWAWIIGCGFFGHVFAQIIIGTATAKDPK